MHKSATLAAAIASIIAATVSAAEPWSVAPARIQTSAPHVLLIYDMEGLAGQGDIASFIPSNPAYAKGQRLLTDDVNAVIDGLFAGGASAVSVADGHGGSTQIDILTDQLDARARMVERPAAAADGYSAVAIVGMHASSGSGGFAAHTWTLGVEFTINGQALNEAQLTALMQGEHGIPLIFVSGDDRLGAELRGLPWIQYVEVKKATGIDSAELYPLEPTRQRMRDAAMGAVRGLPKARVIKATRPLAVTVTAFPPASLSWLADMPGIQYRDQTISFSAPDAEAAYKGMQAIGTAAMHGYSDALFRALQKHPDAKQIELDAIAEWEQKWATSEPERAKARGNPPLPRAARDL
jgi:D-amino peptidase